MKRKEGYKFECQSGCGGAIADPCVIYTGNVSLSLRHKFTKCPFYDKIAEWKIKEIK